MNGLGVADSLYSVPFPGTQEVSSGGMGMSLGQFILGPENGLIRALVELVRGEPTTHTPLLLYGSSGAGKSTALALLVALRREAFGLRNVIVEPAVEFVRGLNRAIANGSTQEFHSLHLRAELLALDDLEQLESSEPAQHELVTLLDHLTLRGRPVLLTVGRIPDTASHFSAALRSRLMSGIAVPIQPPGAAARRRILELLTELHGVQLSPDQLSWILELTDRNVPLTFPQLHSFVLRLRLAIELKEPLFERENLLELLGEVDATLPTTQQIVATVARYYRVRQKELLGSCREKRITIPRSIAMYLARQLTGDSLQAIGRHFSRRDHTTVLHAVRKVAATLPTDPAMQLALSEIRGRLSTKAKG